MTKPVIIVQGGAWGSEAKGTVAAQLCIDRGVDFAVRTGSINAGHTVIYDGKAYKMQTIPVGWVNPGTKLVIGAGAYVHPDILDREVELIAEATGKTTDEVKGRLFIDFRAGIHTNEQHKRESDSGIHERMGSTGEGVAEAIKDKMDRISEAALYSTSEHCINGYKQCICDTVGMLHEAYDDGKQILLEGTQGTMLDLHLGNYPFVTSRQVSASAWATEAGLSPSMEYEVVLVVRSFPIRVAGNSGPLPDEIEWPDFLRELNAKLVSHGMEPAVREEAISDLEGSLGMRAKELNLPTWRTSELTPEQRKNQAPAISNLYKNALDSLPSGTVAELKKVIEMTTVTKKVRRIAHLNDEQLRYAVKVNRPSSIVLTFLNYWHPTLWSAGSWEDIKNSAEYHNALDSIRRVEGVSGVKVSYVNTTPNGIVAVDRSDL